MRKIELLAPAGNIDSFKAACHAKADAIYMGLGRYNARAMAENFDLDSYIECIHYAHKRGIKIHLTLNTLMYHDEIEDALNLVVELYKNGLDAVIVQDMGLARLIHQLLPDLAMHASTQMSVFSLEQVKFLEQLGFTRVVLARELTCEEIQYICEHTTLETEVFIHGALCVSVSGQCLLSSMIGNRSANRGSCAQPCRMKYSLYNQQNEQVIKETYLLSKKDIFGLGYIKKLAECGVTSLKVEGRNKTPEYVAGVISMYRKYIERFENSKDTHIEPKDQHELLQLFNRNGLSTGYLEKVQGKESITTLSPKNTGLLLGEVMDKKEVYIKIKLQEKIDLHDGIEIYHQEEVKSTIVTCIKDLSFQTINCECGVDDIIWIGDIKGAKIGDKVYKTSSSQLNQKMMKIATQKDRVPYSLVISIQKEKQIVIKIVEKQIEIVYEYIPQIAKTKEITKDMISASFEKTQDSDYLFQDIQIQLEQGLFIPLSVLNDIRRKVVETLDKSFEKIKDLSNYQKQLQDIIKQKVVPIAKTKIHHSLYLYYYDHQKDYEKLYQEKYHTKLDRLYVNAASYLIFGKEILRKYSTIDVFFVLPNVEFNHCHSLLMKHLEKMLQEGAKGFVIGNIGYIKEMLRLKKKYSCILIADYSLNITNTYTATFYQSMGIDEMSVSHEVEKIEELNHIIPIEVVEDYISAMTSRYCILGSFINQKKQCSKPCKDLYYLVDSFGSKYPLVCDPISCVMRVIKRISRKEEKNCNIRHVWLK